MTVDCTINGRNVFTILAFLYCICITDVYNVLTVHALALLVKEEATVLQLEKFWQMNAYRIGKNVFSLDDIEHGVLRGTYCNKYH